MSDEPQRITIMLVDDEENILHALKRLLMDEDFDIETATSGEAALERLTTLENVGVIVSDQRMPGMTGALFLGKSQEIVPHAQRILLTGYSDINATIEAINKGGAGRYISKPWDDDELIQAIHDAVSLYMQGAERRRLNEIINQQKQEMEEWNASLKKRLLQSTTTIREQSQAIKRLDNKAPTAVFSHMFDNFFEVMGDRNAVHARTVGILVTDVAHKIGLDAETVASFHLAALLHDAGKFGALSATPHKYLDDMSENEFSNYRQHTLRGEEMFSRVEELAAILPLIRGHHESFDGKGFPDGLKDEQIPLGARLIAIADHIENSARTVEDFQASYALMTAKYCSGTLLDPHLVPKFKDITRTVFLEGKKTGELSEVEINYMEIMPGMIVSREVKSGSGVLLMQRGGVLDTAGIAMIQRHLRKNPPPNGIFVQLVEE